MPNRLGLLSLLCALAAAPGCNELIDTGRFGVRDGSAPGDGGGMDGGGMDGGGVDGGGVDGGGTDGGGVDSCASNQWYRDSDGDTYGDPGVTMTGCAQPAGYVSNADDCDDTTDTIAPRVAEVCDDIDQDCDGAVDEGLMGPIGAPIPIVSDLGIGFAPGEAFVEATNDGYAVFYKLDAATEIRGSFLALDGTFVARDVWIAGGPDVSDLAVTRYTTDGLDQLFVLWRQDATTLRGRLFSTDGVGGSALTVVTVPASTVIRTLEIQQYGSRLLVSWTDDSSHSLVTYDPLLGTSGSILVLPNPPGTDSEWRSVSAIQAPTPFAILVRFTDFDLFDGTFDAGMSGLDGGTTTLGSSVEFLRLVGLDSLSVDEPSAQSWDYGPRCESLGTTCAAFAGIVGRHVPEGEPGLAIAEGMVGTDALDGGTLRTSNCLASAVVDDTGSVTAGACQDVLRGGLPALFDYEARGSVGSLIVPTGAGVGYALREVPLTAEASGMGLVNLPGIEPLFFIPDLSMRGSHGAVLGDEPIGSRNDVILQRIGCEP